MDQIKYQPYTKTSGTYGGFNYGYYFCNKYNCQPNFFKPLRILYKDNCVEKLKKEFELIHQTTVLYKTKGDKISETGTSYAFENNGILIYIERSKLLDEMNDDGNDYDDYDVARDYKSNAFVVTILYTDKKELNRALDCLEIYENKNRNNIYLIVGNPGEGYSLREFTTKLPSEKLDLELNYGSDFTKKHKIILDRLSKNNETGLVILNGMPGTGKTTYIKYLTSLLDKKIIFVPPNMAEGITAPNFLPFLLEHKNSILVIEDAEKVVGSRESSSTGNGVSNILNMTDGILGDCLNIQIIATLNITKELIDKALLRKGRLIADHEFKELPIENVKKLFKALKIDKEATKEMTLSEIYNHDDLEVEITKPRKIGFV